MSIYILISAIYWPLTNKLQKFKCMPFFKMYIQNLFYLFIYSKMCTVNYK